VTGRLNFRTLRATSPVFKLPTKRQLGRYVRELRVTLKQGSIMEQKAFIRSFVRRIDVDYPTAQLRYTCPSVPREGGSALDREVLHMERNGSPPATRFGMF
jgi:hypothetical protein